MRPLPLAPEVAAEGDGRGPCNKCVQVASASRPDLESFCERPGTRGIFVSCACYGRWPRVVWEHQADLMMPAASVIKLAWVLALVESHKAGNLDATALVPLSHLPQSRYRDCLAALPPGRTLALVDLVALSLVTSANTAFEYLVQIPHVARNAPLSGDVVIGSGFSDDDLESAIHRNLVTARASVEMLVRILRLSDPLLSPVRWALANGARTTRLVRDVAEIGDLPAEFSYPNKTGTLAGVRNDVATFTDGAGALSIAVLTQRAGPDVDAQMAHLGASLATRRWAN